MWWFAVLLTVVSVWQGVAVDAKPHPHPDPEPVPDPDPVPVPDPEPLVVYTYPTWAAEMFGTPQEIAQASATAMTQRAPITAHQRLPFTPVGGPLSPLIAVRNAQVAPQHVVSLRQPSTHNIQLLQRPVTLSPYHFFMPSLHLRLPYAHAMPYDARYRPPALYYPPVTYAHSRPLHIDEDEDEEEEAVPLPTYVRVGHFPTAVAGVFTLRTAGDDGPPAPAGIVQSTQPTFSMVPFSNAKAHPILRDAHPSQDGAVLAE